MRSFLNDCRDHGINPADELIGLAISFVLIAVSVTGLAAAVPDRANASGTGLSQVEPVPVSPLRASIPFAGDTQ